MNEIRVASMALAAYFVSSALAQSIIMMGEPVRVKGSYNSSISACARGSSAPTTTRSGFMKSSIAAPCFRNSGLLTTLKGWVVSRRSTSRTFSEVPTGTVLLVTSTERAAMWGATVAAAVVTWSRSASPFSSGGVPTVRKTALDAAAAAVDGQDHVRGERIRRSGVAGMARTS